MSAFTKQVGGDHYTSKTIQPFQLGYLLLAGDAGLVKIAKYLTRNKDDWATQHAKAKHVAEMLEALPVDLRREAAERCSWSPQKTLILHMFAQQEPVEVRTYIFNALDAYIELFYGSPDALTQVHQNIDAALEMRHALNQ